MFINLFGISPRSGEVSQATDKLTEYVTGGLSVGSLPNVTKIKKNAFHGAYCDADKLIIPNSVKELGEACFNDFGIKEIYCEGPIKKIGAKAFMSVYKTEKITLQPGTTEIGSQAFADTQKLIEFHIPEGTTSIGANAFEGSAIQRLWIPGSLTDIPTEAFKGLSSLIELHIAEGVKTIGASAFESIGANEIVLPNSIENIGAGAFTNAGYRNDTQFPVKIRLGSTPTIANNAFDTDVHEIHMTSLTKTQAGQWVLDSDTEAKAYFYSCWNLNNAVYLSDGYLKEEGNTLSFGDYDTTVIKPTWGEEAYKKYVLA